MIVIVWPVAARAVSPTPGMTPPVHVEVALKLPLWADVMRAIERVGASVAAQAGMVGPVFTILLGVLLLGEPFTVWVAVGTALVMAGVAWLARLR